jgi:hypothetical protein
MHPSPRYPLENCEPFPDGLNNSCTQAALETNFNAQNRDNLKKQCVFLVWVLALPVSYAFAQPNLTYPGRYMGREAVNTISTPNGAAASADFADAPPLIYAQPSIKGVSKGIWVIGGYAIGDCVVINTENGLVVADAGDSEAESMLMWDLIRKNISPTPIISAIYTHAHYCLGAGKMVDDLPKALITGHEKLNERVRNNCKSGGAIAQVAALGPVLTARQLIQFCNFLPDTGRDTLRYFVYQPKRLSDFVFNALAHGEITGYPPAVFFYQIDWFDRNVSNLLWKTVRL